MSRPNSRQRRRDALRDSHLFLDTVRKVKSVKKSEIRSGWGIEGLFLARIKVKHDYRKERVLGKMMGADYEKIIRDLESKAYPDVVVAMAKRIAVKRYWDKQIGESKKGE